MKGASQICVFVHFCVFHDKLDKNELKSMTGIAWRTDVMKWLAEELRRTLSGEQW
jgi:hypothetical protein